MPSYRLQEIISVLNYNHINYIIVDKMQNYKITHMKQFKDNKYDFYYQKGLYYKRIIYKMKSINEFLRNNSDTGEIMYLIYDIERCICDIIRSKKRMDIEHVKYAIKEYLKRSDSDLIKLSKYADMFGIKEEVMDFVSMMYE